MTEDLMKTIHLNQARENGHNMKRTTPDQYECTGCSAVIFLDGADGGWKTSRIGTLCPEARVNLTPLGLKLIDQGTGALT